MANEKCPQSGLLVVLCGPSGVGKSTISRSLSTRLNMTYAISATTREKRDGDEKGKTYEYLTPEQFTKRLDADQFLEYAQVYDHLYGTPKACLKDLTTGKDVLLEIDVQGALQVRYHFPAALLIFILPPDEPTLLQRLRDRGRDSADDITKRFRAARREIRMAKGSRAFDYMVINDNLETAVDDIVKIIHHKRAGGI